MKKTNKIVASLLAILLLITSFAGQWAVFGQSEGYTEDVNDSWAKEEISDWLEKGLIKGYQDGTFRPNASISRAEFVTIINRVFGYTDLSIENFKDVSRNEWFYEEISKARNAGYISGYQDGTFRPNDNITRQEAAKIIFEIMKLEKLDDRDVLSDFNDAMEIPDWSRDYLNAVVAKGYINGFPDKTARVTQSITRAETVVMLKRVAGEVINSPGVYNINQGQKIVQGNVTINTDGVILKDTLFREIYI